MTVYDRLLADEKLSPEEKRYYVYVWYWMDGDKMIPFYVGKGSCSRYYQKHGRSKTFQRFIKERECKSMILFDGLGEYSAYWYEKAAKRSLVKQGFELLDGEDDEEQRKAAVREGIEAMPVVNGKRVSSRTGRSMGRQEKRPENFEYVLRRQRAGELTVKEAMAEVGVGRTRWYELAREVAV